MTPTHAELRTWATAHADSSDGQRMPQAVAVLALLDELERRPESGDGHPLQLLRKALRERDRHREQAERLIVLCNRLVNRCGQQSEILTRLAGRLNGPVIVSTEWEL